ncbi:phage terminase large subunit [Paenibacillus alginolyticus]|uniref:phage terminase large subunit n=1 Tax=Paenibacillus alginolyticus TaxID=59839 RepID=UPI001FE80F3B|nr:phage terminase large subunit [Paenibacillus frigoriresistens]
MRELDACQNDLKYGATSRESLTFILSVPDIVDDLNTYAPSSCCLNVLKGGRGSRKSTHITEKFIVDMMRYPVTGLVIRKVARTLEESVFEQLKEAIDFLAVGDYWRVLKSPLQLIYIPRGNKIIFRDADDPLKSSPSRSTNSR